MMRKIENTFIKFYRFFRSEFREWIMHSGTEAHRTGETARFIPQAGFQEASDDDGATLDEERLNSQFAEGSQNLLNVAVSRFQDYDSCAAEFCLFIACKENCLCLPVENCGSGVKGGASADYNPQGVLPLQYLTVSEGLSARTVPPPARMASSAARQRWTSTLSA